MKKLTLLIILFGIFFNFCASRTNTDSDIILDGGIDSGSDNIFDSGIHDVNADRLEDASEDTNSSDSYEDTEDQDNFLKIGSDETLEIATWNLHNFPSTSQTVSKVASIISQMKVDLVAVQEIADVDSFEEMLNQTSQFDGILSTDEYSSGEYQKTGFIYRTDIINLSNPHSLFESDYTSFPRPPLEVDVEVNKIGNNILNFIAINVHLKAGIEEDDVSRRLSACRKIKGYVDTIIAQGTGVIILGDYNDAIDDDAQYNVFTDILNNPENYQFLTLPLTEQNEYSYISYESLIDHQLITSDFKNLYSNETIMVFHLDELLQNYTYEISDHRPVISIFNFN